MRYRDDLFSQKKKSRRGWMIACIIAGILLAVCITVNVVLNAHAALDEVNVTVSALPAGFEGFRILHISDLHGKLFGRTQENILSAVRDRNYDIVCITGDVCGANGSTRAFERLLQIFKENTPILFIPGDEDPNPILSPDSITDSAKADYIRMMENAGAIYLDAPYGVTVRGNHIWFVPENLYDMDVSAYEKSVTRQSEELKNAQQDVSAQLVLNAYHLDRIARIRDAADQMNQNDIHVVLSHLPLGNSDMIGHSEKLQNNANSFRGKMCLILSGHVNNGQWRIPGLGAIYVPEKAYARSSGFFVGEPLAGLYSYAGIQQYLSPGLGNSGIYPFPFNMGRLFNQPSVSILRLTEKLYN